MTKQIRKCDICDTVGDSDSIHGGIKYGFNYLCKKHYSQFYTYGKILNRTRFDKNEIIKYTDYAEVVMYDKNFTEVCRTIIDLEDIDLIKRYKWCHDGKYIKTTFKKKLLQMHRLIMDAKDGEMIDHIDRNRLNNRKSNLRKVDNSENAVNSSTRRDNTSGIIGVHYSKHYEKWIAKLHFKNKRIFCAMFLNKEDAIKSRLQAEAQLLGEFAPQKHLFKKYGITKQEQV